MLKSATKWFAALLLAAGAGQLAGCRACQSGYDYSAPVANCQCEGCMNCGTGRAGSTYSAPVTTGEVIMEAPVPQPPMPQQPTGMVE